MLGTLESDQCKYIMCWSEYSHFLFTFLLFTLWCSICGCFCCLCDTFNSLNDMAGIWCVRESKYKTKTNIKPATDHTHTHINVLAQKVYALDKRTVQHTNDKKIFKKNHRSHNANHSRTNSNNNKLSFELLVHYSTIKFYVIFQHCQEEQNAYIRDNRARKNKQRKRNRECVWER